MKIFYGSKFIEKEKLEEAGINYPIKVEYYKMINEDEIVHKNNPKFGIKVIKTEYQKEEVKSEEKEIKFLSNDEKQVNEILEVLKNNDVTPIAIEDVISDFSKKMLYI